MAEGLSDLARLIDGAERSASAAGGAGVPSVEAKAPAGTISTYGQKAMDGILWDLSGAVEGQRNAKLNHAAFRTFQLVSGGQIPEHVAVEALTSAALGLGLGGKEVALTIGSARRAGMDAPRVPAPLPVDTDEAELRAAMARPHLTVVHNDGEDGPDGEDARPVGRDFIAQPLDISTPPPPPRFLLPWLYAGCLTVLQSEPGVGKTWLAQWAVQQVIEDDYSVMYFDEEGGSDLLRERFYQLQADADHVRDRVLYYGFESRTWTAEDLVALDRAVADAHARAGKGCALAVFDSLADFLAVAGKSEDSAVEVTTFVHNVFGVFRAAGIAVLLLDHLTKPPKDSTPNRGRYSRGSGAKLAKSDATILVEQPEEFDAHTSGTLALWKTKDRRGRIELPGLGDAAQIINVEVMPQKVGPNHVTLVPLSRGDAAVAEATRVRAKVLDNLSDHMPASLSNLAGLVGKEKLALVGVLDALVADKLILQKREGYLLTPPETF